HLPRGLAVEEHTRRREQGFPNTIEVASLPGAAGRALSIEGTVLWGTTPRILSIDGIAMEAPLEGVILFTRNRDVPGVIGQMGMVLGNQGINIATFDLGRAAARGGEAPEALALIGLDGDVQDSVVEPIRKIAAVIEARLVRLS
ncbi:MAG: phosphoglycerate dehydrogenase, partial [Acidobacteria bacterium]|nr:phosphoglycerate dehydrogenase [Acidobacteriota bacterium]